MSNPQLVQISSKIFRLISLSIFLLSTFMAGNIGVAHAQESFADDYYYYVNGDRVQLTPSSNWVSVKFTSDDPAAQALSLKNYGAILGALDQARQIDHLKLTLLPLKESFTRQMAGSLRADSSNFLEVNPVFQTEDAEMAITDEFIAAFPAGTGMEEIEAINSSNGVEIVDSILGQENTFVLRVSVGADLLGMANSYQESGIAIHSAPNFVRIMKTSPAEAQSRQAVNPMTGINDPYYGSQWHLNNTRQFGTGTTLDADIDAPEAWAHTTGSPLIIIAVIDEGVNLTHEDYSSRLVPGYDATGLGGNGAPSGNDSHGTNVGGLAAASSNNGLGVAGVCPQCRIMPVRIAYGDAYGYWDTTDAILANGIGWAYQNGASVLNNSWGGGYETTVLDTAIHNAKTLGRNGKGSVVVFSAGNNNFYMPSYPSFLNDVISVGASNLCDQRKTPTNDVCNGYEYWWGSSYGSSLDISAPGVWLYSTDIMGEPGYDTGNYFSEMNGTSGAAPIVSGVAGLVLSANPDLTANEVQTILQNSADDVNGGGFDIEMGYGRVNADRAVELAGTGTFNISGNAGVGGATLAYTDGSSKTATADNAGLYSFTVPSGWSGTVTPSKAGYVFSPSSKTYTNVLADQLNQNYGVPTGSTFADVSLDYWARPYIESLYNSGISRGCSSNPLAYCPSDSVTRAQMAIFILRGIHGSDYTPPAATGTLFGDVPSGSFAADWIEQLAAEGITSGCGGGNYCPDANITRAQMAVFLLRGEHGSSYTPPAATGTVFSDVSIGSFAVDWIEQLSAEDITGGCGGGNYCPDANVTRDQMAVFLVKAFSLP